MWVPRECFLEHGGTPATPLLLEIPAYSETAYDVVDVVTDPERIDNEHLGDWLGRAVSVQTSYGREVGALAEAKAGCVVRLLMARGYYGGTQGEVVSIGRLVPKAGRRGARLGYEDILSRTPTTVTEVVVRGTTLELTLRVPPDGRKIPVASASDILQLIVAPLRATSRLLQPSLLSQQLERELADRELEGYPRLQEIIPDIAAGYIASFEIVGEATTATSRVSGLTNARIREALAAAWPAATVRVITKDDAWIRHMEQVALPLVLPDRPLPAANATPVPPKPKAVAIAVPPPDERAVLSLADAKSDKTWVAERRGAEWNASWGKRTAHQRQQKSHALVSADKARAAFARAVARKLKEGYQSAPPRAEAESLVWDRLGLAFDDSSGALVVTRVAARCQKLALQDTVWFKPGDRVTGVGPMGGESHVFLVEELATLLARRAPGDQVYICCNRPASGIHTAVAVALL